MKRSKAAEGSRHGLTDGENTGFGAGEAAQFARIHAGVASGPHSRGVLDLRLRLGH